MWTRFYAKWQSDYRVLFSLEGHSISIGLVARQEESPLRSNAQTGPPVAKKSFPPALTR
jgi:hypothetical protein